MKKLLIFIMVFAPIEILLACPVCERNKTSVLQGMVHGRNAESNWDYLIVGIVVIICLLALFYSVRWLLRPGEKQGDHIKRTILKIDDYE